MNNLMNGAGEYLIVQALVAGILSFIGAVAGNIFAHRLQRKNDRKNLSTAFFGEISSILWVIKERNYIAEVERAIRNINEGGQRIFARPIERDYLLVYKENVGKLGVLDKDLPRLIATFYTQISILLDDNQELLNVDFNRVERGYVEKRHEEVLKLLKETEKIGYKILTKLKEFFPELETPVTSQDEKEGEAENILKKPTRN